MLEEFPLEVWVGVAAAASAGLLRGATGFGSALIIAPVLSHLFGAQQAVAISLMIGASATLFLAPTSWRRMSLSVGLTTGAAGILLLLPGVLLLKAADPDVMRKLIGLTTLAAALAMLAFKARAFPAGIVPQLFAGGLGGLIMGATSMGGPPVVLYLVSRRDETEVKKANVVFIVGALEIGALVLLGATGMIELRSLYHFALFLPPFALGMYGGSYAFAFVGERYRSVVLLILLLVGIVAVLG